MESFFLISSILLWVVVILNLILTLGLIRRVSKIFLATSQEQENVLTLGPGTQAPEFNAESIDGQQVSTATYAGREIAFVFVSPTCTPCIDKISTFNRVAPLAKHKGVEMVLVCSADKAETHAFVERQSIKLPVLIAPRESNTFMESFKVPGTPSYCLINEDGTVKSAGFLDTKWEQLIQEWDTGG